jgi:hypothetical protein
MNVNIMGCKDVNWIGLAEVKGQVAGCYEQRNKSVGFVNYKEFHD